jgi:Flp pilus assembly pilin Flp
MPTGARRFTLRAPGGLPLPGNEADSRMRLQLTTMLKDESGASILEYVLIISLASIAAFAALHTLGNKVNTTLLGNSANQIPG